MGAKFRKGDKVFYTTKYGDRWKATVIRVNKKTVTIKSGNMTVRVLPNRLTRR